MIFEILSLLLIFLNTTFLRDIFINKSPIERFYYLSLMREPIVTNRNYDDDGESKISSYGIHGLWPQYSDDNYPSFCKDVSFDYDILKPILPELEEYWYSSQGSGEKFWSHEWKKHGSCMFVESNVTTELLYFQKTLELYHEAIKISIPKKMNCGSKCMIPVSLDLHFNLHNHKTISTKQWNLK